MRTITRAQLKDIRGIPDNTTMLAEQAIASMRDAVNNNQAVMGEIVNKLTNRPKEFLIQRDRKGDMVKIIPVYENEY